MTVRELFDLNHTMAADYLSRFEFPWDALDGLKEEILRLGAQLGSEYREVHPHVWMHETAQVFPSAYLGEATIIGPATQVRHCAFLRGPALVGAGCVIGNSVELKNVIIFDNCEVPHFNYAGDSILGYHAHMGAGSVTSNVRADRAPVIVHCGGENLPTGRKHLGAMLGDYAEIGCNAVLNPGVVVGPHSNVYPTSCVRGTVPANSIWKNDGTILPKR